MIFVSKDNPVRRINIFTKRKLFLLFFIFINSYCLAQSAIQIQFDYANKLFNDEKYFDAITEYKRLQFFDSLNQFSFSSNKLIAVSYKQGGKFNEAVKYFSLAELNAPNPEYLFDSKIEIIKTNLLRRTIYRAFELLKDLDEDERFNSKKDQIAYWKGWAYMFNDDWKKASQEFIKLDANHELARLCKNVYDAQYSQTKAKILSYILPGAGQFYTGNYISGILSFSWIALWSYIAVEAFVADRIFDGLMVANFLDFRFYNGNIQNAKKFAEERNSETSNWMLNHLRNNYNGPKP